MYVRRGDRHPDDAPLDRLHYVSGGRNVEAEVLGEGLPRSEELLLGVAPQDDALRRDHFRIYVFAEPGEAAS